MYIMKVAIIDNKIIKIYAKINEETAKSIIDATEYIGYYNENCRDIFIAHEDTIYYFDCVNWEEKQIDIVDMEIINL